jgi:hypothetical protein
MRASPVGSACVRRCLFCGAPVFVAVLRLPAGQLLKDAGDFFLGGREGFHRRHSLLVQNLGALDWLAGVSCRADARL